jgi:outer membrane protein OmpA-like peptidoglycan-associated protein
MRNLITSLLILVVYNASAQSNTSTEKSQAASVNVVVTDTKLVPRKGEQILFVNEKDNKEFSGRTDARGKFTLSLPAGNTYMIKVKTLNDTTKYSQISIPELQPGQFFSTPFTVNIKFEPARVFTLNNVHFDIGKPTLRPDSFKELNEIADYMNYQENERFEIGGHTDNVGNEPDNLKLSQQRANAVRDYLIKKGINPGRLVAKGYGSSRPVDDNSTDEGRQKNRRTEITIL